MTNSTNQPCEQPNLLLEKLGEAPEPRPFPEVATRLLTEIQLPKTNARRIGEIISCDPATAARVLKLANSSVYAYAGEITTLNRAIVTLGQRTLKNMVLSIAAADVFGKSGTSSEKLLWGHSVGAAVIARDLATKTKAANPEEAFLAAMVHDIGKLVFYDFVPEEYGTFSNENLNSNKPIEREFELFGTDHQKLGQHCAECWGLPEQVAMVIGVHHTQSDSAMTQVINVSNSLAKYWRIGGYGCDKLNLESILDVTALELDMNEVADMETEFQQQVDAIQNICK